MVGSAYPSPPNVTSQVTPMVMTLSKFTEVLRLNEADSKAYESIDWNEQRVAATDRELRGVCWLWGDYEEEEEKEGEEGGGGE